MLNIEKISPEVSPRIRDATPESIPNYWGLTPEKFNFIHSYINPLDLETQLEFRPINYKGEEIYMLLNLLGEGSIGSVYYSEDYLKIDRENQITAAKFPHPMKLKQIKFDSVDIIRHTEIQAILNNEYKYHENLCQKKGEVFLSKRHYRHVFNECRTIKYAWFGMPMVPGQDLKTYMENIHNKSRSNKNENHNHSLFEMMVILLKIFLRIGETHDENWVHMDIKLDNVVHDKKSGDVNLIDFGLVHKKNQPFIVDMAKSHSFRADLKQYDKARFWMDLSALGLLLKEMLRKKQGEKATFRRPQAAKKSSELI